MEPISNMYYQVSIINLFNVLVPIIVEINGFFDKTDFGLSACNCKHLCEVVPDICCWPKIDWRPLLEPRIGSQAQTEIDPHRVDMATLLLIMAGLDTGKVVRILKGEYIGSWRETKKILALVKPHISQADYDHMH